MKNAMKYAFAAIVDSIAGTVFTVTPKIQEHDGTIHPPITVIARDGVTAGAGDTVLVELMMNNKDLSITKRFFEPTESNGVIVGVLKTSGKYVLTGSYKIIGDLTVDTLTVTGTLTAKDLIATNSLTVAGKDIGPAHEHLPGTYSNGGGPVGGASGGVV